MLKKSGELFALRHVLNLSSDLLDTPDFYWDRESLESMYLSTSAHLAIAKRIRITNEKISHCIELMDLVSANFSLLFGLITALAIGAHSTIRGLFAFFNATPECHSQEIIYF